MLRFKIGSAAAALVMGCSAFAAPAPLAEDAKVFGAREAAGQVALSPSGNKVVMLVAGPGSSTQAKVFDLHTGAASTVIASDGKPESLYWCKFASDAQLVCQFGNVRIDNQLVGFSRLITVGVDGKGVKLLGQLESSYDAGIRQFDGAILDWSSDGGSSVLMERNYVPEQGRTGSNISRSKEGLGVDRVDLATLKSTVIEAPNKVISGYLTDGRGGIRIRIMDKSDGHGLLTGTTDYAYRQAASGDWKALGSYDSRNGSGIYPLAIEAETNTALVLKTLDGRDALYRMSLDGTGGTTLIARIRRSTLTASRVLVVANG